MKMETLELIKLHEQGVDARLRAFYTIRDSIRKIEGHSECPTCGHEFTTTEKVEINRIKAALAAEINRAMNDRDELERANAPAAERARLTREARRTCTVGTGSTGAGGQDGLGCLHRWAPDDLHAAGAAVAEKSW